MFSPTLTMAESTLCAALILCLLGVSSEAASSCGQRKIVVSELASDDHNALDGAWPWNGALFHHEESREIFVCGITLLTQKIVITAAQCTFDWKGMQISANRVSIKVGMTNRTSLGDHVQHIRAERIIVHEGFDDFNFENDIALIKLYTNILFTSYVQPICLWQGDSSLAKIVSQVGYFAGWKHDSENLQETAFTIVSKSDCLLSDPDHYARVYHELKTFCAGYRNGTEPGLGNSGGGMVLRVGDTWFVRGILSNGKRDSYTLHIESASYVVFTDVAYYLDWIQKHITTQ